MNPRNRFFILLGIIFLIALGYYFFSTPSNKDLVLIGTVDSNQVIVSPQTPGRLQKLLVDEGTPVKAGDLIAVIDPAELQAQAAAAAATINSLRSKVAEMRYTEQSTKGSTSSDVTNTQAKLRSMKSQLDQAQATLRRTESDSRRTIELAKQGVMSDQESVQAETNLAAAKDRGVIDVAFPASIKMSRSRGAVDPADREGSLSYCADGAARAGAD